MRTRITNATLADGQKTSIDIVDGKVAGFDLTGPVDKEIDVAGKYVLPGVIDTHVHFREPGGEYKEDWTTGSRAAAAGGVTTVLDMPNTNPPTIDAVSLAQKRSLAAKSLVNYGFHLGATTTNGDEIVQLKHSVAGVKIYVGSSTGSLLVAKDAELRQLFSIPNILWLVHAEDEHLIEVNSKTFSVKNDPSIHSKIRDRVVATQALKRIIRLAKSTDSRVHICHVSTKEEIMMIREAKEEKVAITCEVSPHHLFLNDRIYERLGYYAKVNPPLRTQSDNDALLKALRDGVIDIIATDHAPHTQQEKTLVDDAEAEQVYDIVPSGLPEVQTSLPLMLDAVSKGMLTLERLVKCMCTKPAELFHIKGKGHIEVGCDADMDVVDIDKQVVVTKDMIRSKCGWSPYEGRELTGWPVMTFVGGNLVFDNGKINEENKGKEITYGNI